MLLYLGLWFEKKIVGCGRKKFLFYWGVWLVVLGIGDGNGGGC